MNRHLVAVFLAIVLVPLLIVGWLGTRLAREEHRRAGERLGEVMRSTLRGLDADVGALLDERERALRSALGGVNLAATTLRDLTRRMPAVSQLFVVDAATGELVYPSLMDRLPAAEEDFLRRTREIWIGRQLLAGEGRGSDSGEMLGGEAGDTQRTRQGWHPWFWGDGLRLIYWWHDDDGRIVGAELDRMRLISDIIASLPDTDPRDGGLGAGRIRLLDAQGAVLYQWGVYQPAAYEWPLVSQALGHPLAAWSLEYFAAGGTGEGRRAVLFGLLPGVGGLVVLVIGLAFYFFRESSREMRDAAQRVSFVNQVSHELKTPLTNIRMYAELLDAELDDQRPPASATSLDVARRHLGVIVSESQRLSRLILNILSFSRNQRRELQLRRRTGIVDEVVGALLEQFRPSLENHRIVLGFQPGAGRPVSLDPDAVQQIVANLLSNVEKYAAAGKRVDVVTRQAGEEVTITVTDRGPGVTERERRRIFQPFYRSSNALTDGVTGTGIGLAIARDLARLHGGDLDMVAPDNTTDEVNTESGACFQLTLHCPPGTTAPARSEHLPGDEARTDQE